MKKKFDCIKCGKCCQNISFIKELEEYDLGNGICKYLDLSNNCCQIYESRPDICNIEKSFNNYYSKIYTEEEYLKLNYDGCKIIIALDKNNKE